MSASRPAWSAGRVGHAVKQHVQLASERGERPAGQRDRRGVEFQVEAVQLHGDPRIGHRGTDGLVVRQRPGRAVDQEQLELGTDGGGAGPEAGPFQQLPERGQAFLEPLPEARVVALVELFFVYVAFPWPVTVFGGLRPGLWFAARSRAVGCQRSAGRSAPRAGCARSGSWRPVPTGPAAACAGAPAPPGR